MADIEVRALLADLKERAGNLKPALKEIGEIGLESVQRNFEVGGRPQKWAKLSPVTIRQREKLKKWPGKILQRTGAAGLVGSINYRVGDDQVGIGAKKAYATTMHYGAKKGEFGTVTASVPSHKRRVPGKRKKAIVKAHTRKMSVPWGDIPGRPFLLLQDEDMGGIKETIRKHIMAASR